MDELAPKVLRLVGWGALAGGALGLLFHALESRAHIGAAYLFAGAATWAGATTVAYVAETALAQLKKIEANTKRTAELIAQVQQG